MSSESEKPDKKHEAEERDRHASWKNAWEGLMQEARRQQRRVTEQGLSPYDSAFTGLSEQD